MHNTKTKQKIQLGATIREEQLPEKRNQRGALYEFRGVRKKCTNDLTERERERGRNMIVMEGERIVTGDRDEGGNLDR